MKEYASPYAQPFDDSFGVSTSDRYYGGNDVRFARDIPVRHDASPGSIYLDTPHSSYGGLLSPSLVGPQNVQLPIHETNFGQPSTRLHGSTREQFPKRKGHNHDMTSRESTWRQQSKRYQQDLEKCQAEKEYLSEKCQSEKEDLRIRLFHCLKDLKKYREAEELYHEISMKYDVVGEIHGVTEMGGEPNRNDVTKILDLRHTFAEMLIEQKRFKEAEPISKAVWERRKVCPGAPSEDFKKSHRQLSLVLRALRKLDDAERMHNDVYQKGSKDDWALENGDEVCQRLLEQGEFKKAKRLQEEVWEIRLEKHSSRNLTIQSGLRLIGILEELIKPVDHVGGSDAEKRSDSSTRQFLKDRLEVTLEKIWHMQQQPEPNVNILDVGHKLGDLLFREQKFLEADRVLASVWESKERLLGATHESTMSSGTILGSTICRQGEQEHYSRAVGILQPIWLEKQTGTGKCDAGAISTFKDLAQAHCSLGNLQDGECVYRWIWQKKRQDRYKPLEIDEARWDLSVTLYKQGKDKEPEAVSALDDLYGRWHPDTHNPDERLKCGQMLAQLLSTQDEEINKALGIAQDVFERREDSGKKGVDYLESAQLYGSLLLKVERPEDAGSVLRLAWACQPGSPDEQKLRLKCGHLYGQALAGRNKYTAAKRILEVVAADQRGTLYAGDSELSETRRFLEEVIRQEKGWKKGRTKVRPKGPIRLVADVSRQ